MFWISVYGILVDIRDSVEERLRFLSGFGAPVPRAVAAALPSAQGLKAAMEGLQRTLGDDEVIYLAYRRHVECHPFQHGFRLRRDRTGALVETARVSVG